MATGLAGRIVRGGAWMGGSFALGKVISVAQQIVLVRLLTPEHFGLVSIALIAIGTLDIFTQTGIESALIQRKDLKDRALQTGWTVIVGRSILVFAALQAIAGPVAAFFEAPEATALMRWLAVPVIVDAMASPELFRRQRELDYKPHAVIAQAFNVTSLAVSVGYALYEASPWAIVYGRVVGSVVRTATSYAAAPGVPRPRWDAESVRGLVAFGRWVFIGNILLFATMRGDDALVGKLLGKSALGFYTVAYALANTPTPTIGYLVSKIALPTYAKQQDDIAALSRSYLFVLKCTATIALPSLGGLFVLAPDVVRLVYGETWMPIVTTLRILCVYGGLRCLMASAGPLFHGTGRPELLTRTAAVQFVLTALAIYFPTVNYGIEGTSLAITGALGATALLSLTYVARTIQVPVRTVVAQMVPAAAAAVLMTTALYGLEQLIRFDGATIALPIVLGSALYGVLIWRFDGAVFGEFRRLIGAVRAPA